MPTVNSGLVKKITTDPLGFLLQTSPGPPPETVVYTDVSAEQWKAAKFAMKNDYNADVEGTPPACTKVTVSK